MSDTPPYYLNNPGMLSYGPLVARLGAFDYDIDNYAFFPDYDTGRAALKTLFFTVYADWGFEEGLDDFLSQYTRVNDYNVSMVARTLCNRAGVDPLNDRFSDCTPVQQEIFLDAYQRMTGWKAGGPAGNSTITRITLPDTARL